LIISIIIDIIIEYGARVEINQLPPNQIDIIKQNLTIFERDYQTNEIVTLEYFLIKNNYIYFPFFYINDFCNNIKFNYGNKYDFQIFDKRDEGKSLSYNQLSPNFSYRKEENQEYYVKESLKYEALIIKRPPGSGKTIIGSCIILMRNSRTLILCNQTELIKQWNKALKLVSDNNIKVSINSFLKDNSTDYDVYISTVQGLLSYYSKHGLENTIEYLDKYNIGQILFDECHLLIGPEKFSLISYLFRSKYRIGLSATPVRDSDKSKLIINYWLGYNIIGKSDYKVIPTIKVVKFYSGLSKKNKYKDGKKLKNSYWYINWQRRDNKGKPIGYPKFFMDRYLKFLFKQEHFLNLIYQFVLKSILKNRQILVITHFNKDGVNKIYDYLIKQNIDTNNMQKQNQLLYLIIRCYQLV